ncbi:hypothetical protein I6B53_10555 [Schaalia sp. 19OD2882]|uniref:DUF6541 family protein n=1 Tax=Schaalia sp. 19OD2882 TaxID=2794089 RepID=UPI001C1EEFF8|nr:DUF6541 family protein [Schaalia sp. 19OD2882]QWW19502.1 hypothetical protein I6B53_10555 [Schaalia sp. 19OD2882]
MIAQWLSLTPLLAAMCALTFLPALPWALMVTRTRTGAIAASAALGFALIPLLSITWDALDIPWQTSTVLPVYGVFFVVGLGLHLARWAFASTTRAGPRQVLGEVWCASWPLVLAVLVGWILAGLAMLIRADPGNPPQQWDSTFHLNGVWSMIHIHEGSPFNALRELYGGQPTYYPNSWHAFVALFAQPDTVVQASNVSTLLLMAVWVVGAAGMVRSLTSDRSIVVVATVISGVLLTMPADALTMYNQWPHATGAALVPGVIVLGLEAGRHLRGLLTSAGFLRTFAGAMVAFVAAATGAVGGHPSAAFFVLVVLLPPYLASAWTISADARKAGRPVVAVGALVAGALGVVGPLGLLMTPQIRGMGNYPRSGLGWDYAFSRFITPFPPFVTTWGLSATIVVLGFLTVFGGWLLLWPPKLQAPDSPTGDLDAVPAPSASGSQRHRSAGRGGKGRAHHPDGARGATRETASHTAEQVGDRVQGRATARPVPAWALASFLSMAMLTFLAYGPDLKIPVPGMAEPFEPRIFFLAPWYMDPRRIMAIHGLMSLPLIATGVVWVARFLQELFIVPADRARLARREAAGGRPSLLLRRQPWEVAVLVAVLVLTNFGALGSRFVASDYVYDPSNLGKPGMATQGELDMIRRMPQTLPEDALVVGDPIAGEAYTEVIGHREAVFPQLTLNLSDWASQKVLYTKFKDIHTDPEVCRVVRKLGITHFYQDADGRYYTWNRSSRHPGFYGVDTSKGFELVDEGDQAKLWKITACS